MPGAASGPAPDAPGEPDRDAGRDAGATETEYPERPRPGAVLTASGQPPGPAEYDAPAGPGDPAGPPARDVYDVYDVYDIEDWPEDSRGGWDGPGRNPPGPRAWPDTAKSLYSRGWPVMDSLPHRPDLQQAGNETEAGAAGEPDAAQAAGEDAGAPGRPDGARVYVLDESRRSGR